MAGMALRDASHLQGMQWPLTRMQATLCTPSSHITEIKNISCVHHAGAEMNTASGRIVQNRNICVAVGTLETVLCIMQNVSAVVLGLSLIHYEVLLLVCLARSEPHWLQQTKNRTEVHWPSRMRRLTRCEYHPFQSMQLIAPSID